MNRYVSEHRIDPPSYLKEKIINTINGVTNSSASPVTRNFTLQTGKSSTYYWSIAATFLLLLSTSFAIYFGLKNNQLNNTLAGISKTNSALSDSMKGLYTNLAQMQSDMAILKDPMYKIVELKGLKPAPEAKAMVCWCPTDKKVYVEIDRLPVAPQGMQYQLWAIVDGKPISEGMITMGNGLHAMKDVDNAQAFAVTLEKEGGSPTPKGDMYVMGTI